jgi:hypothetical protein
MGKNNPQRNNNISSNKRLKKERLEVKTAAAVAEVEIPALTKQQMVDATSKALLIFNKKLLEVRNLNEEKVIVVSIAVTAEGLHPSGRNVGNTIENEMQETSLWSTAGIANLVRLVTRKGETYFENPTYAE